MNKARRKELAKATEMMNDARDIIESCMEEEQDYLDNMPENLQYSEKHEMAESAVESMENAIDKLEEAMQNVEDAME